MTGWRSGTWAAVGALLLWGSACGFARAEGGTPTQNPNAFISPDSLAAPHKSLQLDASGRWTLKLDMDPPVGQAGVALKDVSAGAFFHITPSMRIGGSVGLGDRQADAEKFTPQDANAPRVHVETKFKF